MIIRSLRSRRKRRAWGVSPGLWLTKKQRAREAGGSAIHLTQAAARFAGSPNLIWLLPGAHAPGSMLTPAPQVGNYFFLYNSGSCFRRFSTFGMSLMTM